MFKSYLQQNCGARVFESDQRKLVDCSDPDSEKGDASRRVISATFDHDERVDLNHPPTPVGGILNFPRYASVGRI